MELTQKMQGLILKRLRQMKQTRKWLAEQVNQSETWVSRLLSDDEGKSKKEITEKQMDALQTALGIEFYTIVPKGSQSTASQHIARLYDSNPAFAKVAEALGSAMNDVIFTPRYIPEKEMGSVGAKIREIVEDPNNRGKDGKIARLVLELLA
jgi:hypothetical protein